MQEKGLQTARLLHSCSSLSMCHRVLVANLRSLPKSQGHRVRLLSRYKTGIIPSVATSILAIRITTLQE